jgi:hypothetical protein
VRSRTFREDDSKVRTGTPAPRHGLPTQPRHQRLPPERSDQHRRSPPPHQPRLPPAPTSPRSHMTNPDRSRSCNDSGADPAR